jgi:hypothetical protein
VSLAALALAGLIAGCGRATAPAPTRVSYLRHHSTKTYGDCTAGLDRCTRITLRWPMATAAPTEAARESINAFVRATLFPPYDGGAPLANEDTVMLGFIEAYRGFAATAPGGATHPWWFERRIEPLGDTLGVTSLAVSERSFLGGAHPNSTTRFTNIDTGTGRTLRFADLLMESARDSLDALGERAFRRVRKLPPEADLAAEGFWFEPGGFRLNDNLAVTPTGILFFFNDYEIAPHALGATQISLPWDEVAPYVRADGPLGRHGRR